MKTKILRSYVMMMILSSISFILVGSSIDRVARIKSGAIILLNGTSSAGKSSIVRELQNM